MRVQLSMHRLHQCMARTKRPSFVWLNFMILPATALYQALTVAEEGANAAIFNLRSTHLLTRVLSVYKQYTRI